MNEMPDYIPEPNDPYWFDVEDSNYWERGLLTMEALAHDPHYFDNQDDLSTDEDGITDFD